MEERDFATEGTAPARGDASGVRAAARTVKDEASALASEATREASRVAGQAREQATNAAHQRKDAVAERVGRIASALKDAAFRLEGDEEQALGRYASQAADRVEAVAGYLRNHDLRGLQRDAELMARRHPQLFLGGAFAAGILLARFLKGAPPPDGGSDYAEPFTPPTFTTPVTGA